ncbi:hypothetical protein TNIN_131711 [Trichonephila inaurata madagascariensis]|uniref:Uncharacterized protein n=1 Tax=Trichonephila inaurata madagascariensis TaxID=2747483 RepID=A0A8X6YUB3_9ARAC|nr:hypothetical protein TNIN_131711 [Trichonephila inaurata madagascariensis]
MCAYCGCLLEEMAGAIKNAGIFCVLIHQDLRIFRPVGGSLQPSASGKTGIGSFLGGLERCAVLHSVRHDAMARKQVLEENSLSVCMLV